MCGGQPGVCGDGGGGVLTEGAVTCWLVFNQANRCVEGNRSLAGV